MINRRQFFHYGKVAALAGIASTVPSAWQQWAAQTTPSSDNRANNTNSLSVQWLGHTCFLFEGEGQRVLVNPFRTVGCTAGYPPPLVSADLVLISSRLLDEGNTEGLPGQPRLLFEPGSYQFRNKQIQGIRTDHDRYGGRRFGINVAWSWTQAGVKILHLGGAAAPINSEQQILMGRPDLLLLPVGGGPKAYTPSEAKEAMVKLNPKVVIPMHYRTTAADAEICDLVEVDEFLSVLDNRVVEQVNADSLELTTGSLPETGPVIKIMSYQTVAG